LRFICFFNNFEFIEKKIIPKKLNVFYEKPIFFLNLESFENLMLVLNFFWKLKILFFSIYRKYIGKNIQKKGKI